MLFSKKQKKPVVQPAKITLDTKPRESPTVEQRPISAGHRLSKNVYRSLIKPIITEKATGLGVLDKYVFEVAPQINKIEVQKGIKELYGFQPIKIQMIKVKGKLVRYGRSSGYTKNWKKAIVTLKKGDKINFATHQ